MNYSSSYTPQSSGKPKRPRFISMLAGFAISAFAGFIIAQFSAIFISMLGNSGGLQCLTFPLKLIIFGGSAALSYFLTRIIQKKSRPNY